jgi:hypothetical protein
MSEIILTDEQARILAESDGFVVIRDGSGQTLGHIEIPLSPEKIAELKRTASSPGPFFTGQQVQARLKALEAEWERTGGFGLEYMDEFLARLDKEDPGHMRIQDTAE